MDYKKTLNLPDTPFPMRGDLARDKFTNGILQGNVFFGQFKFDHDV